MQQYDALVIGGGPAGATAALLLARAGWTVAVVERKSFPRRKVCGEYLSGTNWPLLSELGLSEAFADLAGPTVRRTAIFVRNRSAHAPLPRQTSVFAACGGSWGRALARENLDTLLLTAAQSHGAQCWQPYRVASLAPEGGGYLCSLESSETREMTEVRARVIIAAHGSWEIGSLATQRQPMAARPSDWMAFKAHFSQSSLLPGLMPLLSFPDGYGGMVHCDGGRVSLSCCIRRSRLARLSRRDGQSAGQGVLEHILESTTVLRPVLESAVLEGPWLSAGPIQPGIRPRYRQGIYIIGNAAGEAHPVVAEGISMAMQSAWLLASELSPHRRDLDQPGVRARIGRDYSSAWRKNFAPRIRAAAAIAHWAARPALVAATLPLVRSFPPLLTWGARLSGKARNVVPLATELPAS